MGERGSIPKRSDQRRRANEPDIPLKGADGVAAEMPEPDPEWHPVAMQWFESLGRSGQSVFYQASDWATAFLLAESISREFKPQVVGSSEDGEPIWAQKPPTGASLAAWLKGMTALLVTEGDRRRASVELSRPSEPDGEAADVCELDEYRSRIPG